MSLRSPLNIVVTANSMTVRRASLLESGATGSASAGSLSAVPNSTGTASGTRTFGLIEALAALFLFSCAASAVAVEDDMVVEGPIIANPQEQMVRQFGVQNFDQMLFQNDGNATKGEQRMRVRTELKFAELDQVCQLNEEQKRKLQLASCGDLQRFRAQADALRLKFEKLVKEQKQNDAEAFNQAYQQMWQEIQPLQMRMNTGLSEGGESMLAKVLSQTLTIEQKEKYAVVTTERQRFRYETNIAVCLHNLEDVVFLSESQREEITKLLLVMPPPRQTGQYESYAVQCRMSMIPVERLEPIFKPDQWRKFKPQYEQYRNIRQSWVQAGLLDAEDFANPVAGEKP